MDLTPALTLMSTAGFNLQLFVEIYHVQGSRCREGDTEPRTRTPSPGANNPQGKVGREGNELRERRPLRGRVENTGLLQGGVRETLQPQAQVDTEEGSP